MLPIFLCNNNLENKNINKNSKKNETQLIFENINSNLSFNKKNVLLSVVIEYSWEKIFPFVKSLINAKIQNCDFVMFIRKLSKSVINYLRSFGIVIYEIEENPNIKIFSLRWKIYSKFLKNNKSKYNLVLSVDIRDTIIQNDLFSLYKKFDSFLAFSFEDATVDKLINNNWIIDKYGIEIFKKIRNEKTVNAGTVWGTVDKFIEFADILWERLSIFPEAIDQTVINYLIYHERILHNFLRFSDLNGPVMTIGLTKKGNIKIDSENNIINYKGNIASIVHQYDRHRNIKILIKNKYCPELIYKRNIKNGFILSIIFSILMIIYLIKVKYKKKFI